jgi:hypothetical protein
MDSKYCGQEYQAYHFYIGDQKYNNGGSVSLSRGQYIQSQCGGYLFPGTMIQAPRGPYFDPRFMKGTTIQDPRKHQCQICRGAPSDPPRHLVQKMIVDYVPTCILTIIMDYY